MRRSILRMTACWSFDPKRMTRCSSGFLATFRACRVPHTRFEVWPRVATITTGDRIVSNGCRQIKCSLMQPGKARFGSGTEVTLVAEESTYWPPESCRWSDVRIQVTTPLISHGTVQLDWASHGLRQLIIPGSCGVCLVQEDEQLLVEQTEKP